MADVIRLVRIVRLRAVGMPIPRIAAQLGEPASGNGELRQLAAELREEIARLTALHDRLLTMSEQAGPSPAEIVSSALRDARRLAPDSSLAPVDAAATELVDALHSAGAVGIVEAMAPLLADPLRADRLGELVRQVQQLPDDLDDERLDQLVRELVSLLPKTDPAPVPVDVRTFEKLVGHRLTAVQRRFQRRMRAALEAGR